MVLERETTGFLERAGKVEGFDDMVSVFTLKLSVSVHPSVTVTKLVRGCVVSALT